MEGSEKVSAHLSLSLANIKAPSTSRISLMLTEQVTWPLVTVMASVGAVLGAIWVALLRRDSVHALAATLLLLFAALIFLTLVASPSYCWVVKSQRISLYY